MKNLSWCQNFKLVWWIVLVSDKLIIKSLHAMLRLYHRGKKRNSCPKMENQGSRTTKNDEVSGLMNIFKLQNPLFEQVNTKKKCTFIFNSNSPNSVQNVQMCPNCQIRPKNVQIMSNLKKPKHFQSTRAVVQYFKISNLF